MSSQFQMFSPWSADSIALGPNETEQHGRNSSGEKLSGHGSWKEDREGSQGTRYNPQGHASNNLSLAIPHLPI